MDTDPPSVFQSISSQWTLRVWGDILREVLRPAPDLTAASCEGFRVRQTIRQSVKRSSSDVLASAPSAVSFIDGLEYHSSHILRGANSWIKSIYCDVCNVLLPSVVNGPPVASSLMENKLKRESRVNKVRYRIGTLFFSSANALWTEGHRYQRVAQRREDVVLERRDSFPKCSCAH